MDEKIFRAYDIRGTYPDQVNEEVAYKIASAYAEKIKPKMVGGLTAMLLSCSRFSYFNNGMA